MVGTVQSQAISRTEINGPTPNMKRIPVFEATVIIRPKCPRIWGEDISAVYTGRITYAQLRENPPQNVNTHKSSKISANAKIIHPVSNGIAAIRRDRFRPNLKRNFLKYLHEVFYICNSYTYLSIIQAAGIGPISCPAFKHDTIHVVLSSVI